MARKLRVEYAGAIYHVMNRGDCRELIFHDDFDRKRFVSTLDVVFKKPIMDMFWSKLDIPLFGKSAIHILEHLNELRRHRRH